jgi:hypothetical protein
MLKKTILFCFFKGNTPIPPLWGRLQKWMLYSSRLNKGRKDRYSPNAIRRSAIRSRLPKKGLVSRNSVCLRSSFLSDLQILRKRT